jgi:hypothetical protein
MESTCLPHFPRPSTFDGLSRRSLVEPDARRYECEACGRLAAGRGQVRCEKGKAPPAGVQFRLAGPPLARRVPGGCLTRRCARKVGRAGKRNLNPARPLRGEQPSHGAFLSRSLHCTLTLDVRRQMLSQICRQRHGSVRAPDDETNFPISKPWRGDQFEI